MALPSSGTISLNDLQTEFGGSNPIEISEYYRGGSRVPNITVNNSVPTSGQISLSNFYGAQAADPNPTAFDFSNIGLSGSDFASGNTNTVTITGINVPITLDFRTTAGSLQVSGFGFPSASSQVLIYVNGNLVTPNLANNMDLFAPPIRSGETQFQKITVSNNDTIYVEYNISVSGDPGDGGGTSTAATWTVSNDSSGNTTLDTFTLSGSLSVS